MSWKFVPNRTMRSHAFMCYWACLLLVPCTAFLHWSLQIFFVITYFKMNLSLKFLTYLRFYQGDITFLWPYYPPQYNPQIILSLGIANHQSVRAKSRLRDSITQTWYYHVCVILCITQTWYLISGKFLTLK